MYNESLLKGILGRIKHHHVLRSPARHFSIMTAVQAVAREASLNPHIATATSDSINKNLTDQSSPPLDLATLYFTGQPCNKRRLTSKLHITPHLESVAAAAQFGRFHVGWLCEQFVVEGRYRNEKNGNSGGILWLRDKCSDLRGDCLKLVP